jgi:hydrogenase expression/formation protein HypC
MMDEHEHLAKVEVAGVRRTINIGLLEEEGVGIGDWGPHPRRLRHVQNQ